MLSLAVLEKDHGTRDGQLIHAVAATILIVTTSTLPEVANTDGPSCGASTPLMPWSLSGRTGRRWLYRSLIWPTGRSIAGFHYMGNRDGRDGLTKGRRNTNRGALANSDYYSD